MEREGLKVVFVDTKVNFGPGAPVSEVLVGDIITRNGLLYSGVFTCILPRSHRQHRDTRVCIAFHDGGVMTRLECASQSILPLLILVIATGHCHAQSGWFWQHPLPQGHHLYAVSFFDSDLGLAVGDAGTILRTTDAGTTWARQESGSTKTLFGVAFFDALHAVAVGEYGCMLRSTDGGAHWSRQAEATTQTLKDIPLLLEHRHHVGTFGTVLRSDDGWRALDRKSVGHHLCSQRHRFFLRDLGSWSVMAD
jgi:hypothetical protein